MEVFLCDPSDVVGQTSERRFDGEDSPSWKVHPVRRRSVDRSDLCEQGSFGRSGHSQVKKVTHVCTRTSVDTVERRVERARMLELFSARLVDEGEAVQPQVIRQLWIHCETDGGGHQNLVSLSHQRF